MIQNLLNKIKKWQNRRKFLVVIAWSLILLGPILTGLTVSILQGEFGSKLSNILRLILLVDGIYLLVVISIVGYAVMKMFAARRAKSAGSRLHMRLSRVFYCSTYSYSPCSSFRSCYIKYWCRGLVFQKCTKCGEFVFIRC